MKIIIRNLQKKIPINPKRIKKAILKVFSLEGIKESGEITVCFVNDKKIRALNSKFLGINSPTDVIAFDMGERTSLKADIAISTDTARSNSAVFNTTPSYELYLYLIHGILHLLSYDDKTVKQRKIMEKRATEILKQIKIQV